MAHLFLLAVRITGISLAILGLAGVPEDIRGWWRFLNALDQDTARWVLVMVGLLLIAFASVPRMRLWERSARNQKQGTPKPRPAHIGYNEGEKQAEEAAKRAELAAAVDNEPFHWDNVYAADDAEPNESDLFLYLELTIRGESRWRRGVRCEVRAPSGRLFTSPVEMPDSQNRFTFYYPEHFDASVTLDDGKYVITWHDAVDKGLPPIASREIEIRQVLLSSHRGDQEPGQRLVLEASEARQMVRDGVGTYLFEDQE